MFSFGTTHMSSAKFVDYLQSIDGFFSKDTYRCNYPYPHAFFVLILLSSLSLSFSLSCCSVLSNNCNTFTAQAVYFLTGNRLPPGISPAANILPNYTQVSPLSLFLSVCVHLITASKAVQEREELLAHDVTTIESIDRQLGEYKADMMRDLQYHHDRIDNVLLEVSDRSSAPIFSLSWAHVCV